LREDQTIFFCRDEVCQQTSMQSLHQDHRPFRRVGRGDSIRRLRAWWSPQMLENFLDNSWVGGLSNSTYLNEVVLSIMK
jgi:hypothetical protein